jgi:peroxiredoxin
VRDEQTEYRKHRVTTLGVNPASVASHEHYAESFQFDFRSCPTRAARASLSLSARREGSCTVYLIGTDGTVRFASAARRLDAILASSPEDPWTGAFDFLTRWSS